LVPRMMPRRATAGCRLARISPKSIGVGIGVCAVQLALPATSRPLPGRISCVFTN